MAPMAPLQRRQQPRVVDPDLVVVGVETLGDKVRVTELVAGLTACLGEADAEGLQVRLPRLGQ